MADKNWLSPTPITYGKNWAYKREDLFAPFGDKGINGSKLRQVFYLCELAKELGYKGIVSGAVSASPQHPMVTRVALKYGLSSLCVTGASKIEQYPMLFMAGKYGAEFHFSKVGYAPALNLISKNIAKEKNLFHLETNITVTGEPDYLYKFHKIGARQVENLPRDLKTLMIPLGSCNSAVSVLVGLAEDPLPNLEKIILFGIGAYGSSKPDYVPERMRKISQASGINYDGIFEFDLEPHPQLAQFTGGRIKVVRYDLNGTGFCTYKDTMPAEQDGIVFHPRYEGKIIHYINRNKAEFAPYQNKDNCFWNVGVQPTIFGIIEPRQAKQPYRTHWKPPNLPLIAKTRTKANITLRTK